MFYYTYKVTLLKGSLAGKYYYGQHRTKNLEDGYIGSGTMIRFYFKKYPIVEGVTYVRQILAFYSDEEELNRAEKELVGDRYETDPNCLNLKAGGKQTKLSTESKKKISLALTGRKHSEEHCRKNGEAHRGLKPRLGSHPSEETRRKMSEAHKGPRNYSPETIEKKRLASTGKKYPGRSWTKDPVTGKRIYTIKTF